MVGELENATYLHLLFECVTKVCLRHNRCDFLEVGESLLFALAMGAPSLFAGPSLFLVAGLSLDVSPAVTTSSNIDIGVGAGDLWLLYVWCPDTEVQRSL
jgi:hypothetical protein